MADSDQVGHGGQGGRMYMRTNRRVVVSLAKFAIKAFFPQTYRPRMASLLDHFVFPPSAHIIHGPYTTFMNLLSIENVTLRSAMAKKLLSKYLLWTFSTKSKSKVVIHTLRKWFDISWFGANLRGLLLQKLRFKNDVKTFLNFQLQPVGNLQTRNFFGNLRFWFCGCNQRQNKSKDKTKTKGEARQS